MHQTSFAGPGAVPGWRGRFALRRQVHPLVAAILRLAGLDALNADPESDERSRQLCQAAKAGSVTMSPGVSAMSPDCTRAGRIPWNCADSRWHQPKRFRCSCPDVWNLRSRRSFRELSAAFAETCNRAGFRLIHFSVQGNHRHLIVEASDEVRLSRGLQGLAVRIARRLNRLMGRTGKVFADRFHQHVLRSPAEVARAVAYVLGNFVVHALRRGEPVSATAPDEYSSARQRETGPPLVAPAQSWLLRGGWRRGAALETCNTGRISGLVDLHAYSLLA